MKEYLNIPTNKNQEKMKKTKKIQQKQYDEDDDGDDLKQRVVDRLIDLQSQCKGVENLCGVDEDKKQTKDSEKDLKDGKQTKKRKLKHPIIYVFLQLLRFVLYIVYFYSIYSTISTFLTQVIAAYVPDQGKLWLGNKWIDLKKWFNDTVTTYGYEGVTALSVSKKTKDPFQKVSVYVGTVILRIIALTTNFVLSLYKVIKEMIPIVKESIRTNYEKYLLICVGWCRIHVSEKIRMWVKKYLINLILRKILVFISTYLAPSFIKKKIDGFIFMNMKLFLQLVGFIIKLVKKIPKIIKKEVEI
jgi:hypothetical protein